MQVLYTARLLFDNSIKENGTNRRENIGCFLFAADPWESYKAWSGSYHIKELVTLDSLLNKLIPKLEDWNNKGYWQYS